MKSLKQINESKINTNTSKIINNFNNTFSDIEDEWSNVDLLFNSDDSGNFDASKSNKAYAKLEAAYFYFIEAITQDLKSYNSK